MGSAAARLRSAAAGHGLAVCGLSARPGHAAGQWAAGFERLVELAQAAGAPRLRLLAPPYAGGDLPGQQRALAGQLAERAGLARAAGLRLLVQLAPGTLAPGPEWFLRIGAGLPPGDVGAGYDPGSLLEGGPAGARLAIAALGPYLQYVYVHDRVPRRGAAGWEWACTRPGDGLVCWPGVLAALAAAGYEGWLVISRLSEPAGPARLAGDVAALARLSAAAGAEPGSQPAGVPAGPADVLRKVTA